MNTNDCFLALIIIFSVFMAILVMIGVSGHYARIYKNNRFYLKLTIFFCLVGLAAAIIFFALGSDPQSPKELYFIRDLDHGMFGEINDTTELLLLTKESPDIRIVGFEPIRDRNVPQEKLNEVTKEAITFFSPVAYVMRILKFRQIPQSICQLYETYFDAGYPKLRQELHDLFLARFEIDDKVIKDAQSLIPKNTIGVHVRYAAHYTNAGGEQLKFDDLCNFFFRELDEALKEAPKSNIFLATHLEEAISVFKNRYKEKIFTVEATRNKKQEDWVNKVKSDEMERYDVVRDALMLSNCDLIIGGPSNVFFFTLYYNTTLKFRMPVEFKGRRSG